MKRANKGKEWNARADAMLKARDEIDAENKDTDVKMTSTKRRKAILDRATSLAQAMVEVIKEGGFFEAFAGAGLRMERANDTAELYQKAFDDYMNDPKNEEKKRAVEEMEEAYAATRDYQTCLEKGEQQVDYLKALDFVDTIGPKMRIYNVCRAKTSWDWSRGVACSCGLAFPNKMWYQPNPHRWKYKCRVMWEPLVREQEKNPADPMLRKWVDDMTATYGEVEKWPQLGCESNFVPFKKGGSMVVEIKQENGEWTSFVAERLPEELDDEIKRVHAHFYMAQQDLTPEELKEILPISFPMTHNIKGFPGVARYPVDEWEAAGAPYFSVKSWCKMAMRIASNDLTNLGKVFETAQKISGGLPSSNP